MGCYMIGIVCGRVRMRRLCGRSRDDGKRRLGIGRWRR